MAEQELAAEAAGAAEALREAEAEEDVAAARDGLAHAEAALAAARWAEQERTTQLPTPAPLPPLSAEDVEFFVREGYLIKRGALDAAQCAAARDALWAGNTSSFIQRDAPASHVGPVREEDENHDMMNYRRGDQWRLRGMCSTPLVLDLFPRRCKPWFEQLLGEGEVVEPVVGSRRGWNNWGGYETRGVYCVLPTSTADPIFASTGAAMDDGADAAAQTPADLAERRRAELARGLKGAHVDPQPSHMVVACYIDEVPEGGGGFCIFPRSHREFYARDPVRPPPTPRHPAASLTHRVSPSRPSRTWAAPPGTTPTRSAPRPTRPPPTRCPSSATHASSRRCWMRLRRSRRR